MCSNTGIEGYYPRLRYARSEGWINRSIVCLGFMSAHSNLNPGGWTKESLKATILKLKRDFPEMPGIGFYGPGAPGNMTAMDKYKAKPDLSDNARSSFSITPACCRLSSSRTRPMRCAGRGRRSPCSEA